MAELAFLDALQVRLTAAGLTPVPKAIGVVEPGNAASLPALVLSIDETSPARTGIGGLTRTMTGALSTKASINLANPVLATDPTFRLLDPTRKQLILPHGGLVRVDGTAGPIGSGDATVRLGPGVRPVVLSAPTGAQVTVDAAVGKLTFATALPAAGQLQVTYFIGQWEQRVEHIAGILRIDVCGASATDTATLSEAALDALAVGTAGSIPGVSLLAPKAVSAIGPEESAQGNLRRRTLRFAFDYERLIDRPDASGGIISRIPIITHLRSLTVEASTGAINEVLATEID
jgi:hypothetical protein